MLVVLGSDRLRRRGHAISFYGGDARIEPDGSATVRWDGSWTVNFYGGLVPFTFTDPEIEINGAASRAITYALMRGTLAANGVNVFAGFYTPPSNDEFGCVSVSLTIP